MSPLYSEAVGRLIERVDPPTDDVLDEMDERARTEGFPTVGPAVGRTLALCVRLLGARSVLELGSGFGYSAYWIACTLPTDGRIVLTERDADLLAEAQTYFERGGLDDRAVFEHGDAIEIARGYDERDESFDLVVLDHDTAEYVRGFDAVGESVASGGAVVVDNLLATDHTAEVLSPAGLLATLDGERAPNDRTRAVADFYEHVGADPDFELYVLPVGEGLVIACRV